VKGIPLRQPNTVRVGIKSADRVRRIGQQRIYKEIRKGEILSKRRGSTVGKERIILYTSKYRVV
jgi:hypothetical protein